MDTPETKATLSKITVYFVSLVNMGLPYRERICNFFPFKVDLISKGALCKEKQTMSYTNSLCLYKWQKKSTDNIHFTFINSATPTCLELQVTVKANMYLIRD